MQQKTEIGVLGAGSWGLALAAMLARMDYNVTVWEFNPQVAEKLRNERKNFDLLNNIILPDEIRITSDAGEAVMDKDYILGVTPVFAIEGMLQKLNSFPVHHETIWINASKGVDPHSLKRISEIYASESRHYSPDRYVNLTGPSHAEEVAINLPSSIVAASVNIVSAKKVQQTISNEAMRIYITDDLIGTELGGALKNILAIATGICDGLRFGDNTKGALVTRGLVEMTRIGVHLGGKRETFSGLSGLGDLMATCFSRHSRNRYVGEQIGLGYSLDEVLSKMKMVAEGVNTTRAVHQLAKNIGISTPITDEVYSLLFDGKSPREAVIDLMSRNLKKED